MSQEEIIEELQAENARLREESAQVSAEKKQLAAENHQLREQVSELSRRLHELEGRVAKDSRTSHKPPSSDGYARKTRSLRQKSGKKPGGQEGHAGSTLRLVETADEIIVLRPEECGCELSPATLQACVAEGADRLVETEEQIKQALQAAPVMGTDETGMRVQGVLQWLHTARTETLTHYACHRKRGKTATDAIGILPQFHGVAVHDGYSSYPQYTQCEHALCNAHLLRELRFLQ